jgi:hypothetical protein
MKPIEFTGCNIVYGKGQEEYQPLPAIKCPDGQVITCWELTPEEIEQVRINGKIYLQQLTFNQPLQPILPIVNLEDGLAISL